MTTPTPLDLSTTTGARQYLAEYFDKTIGNHFFKDYIREALAADFACALSQHLEARAALAAQPDETEISFDGYKGQKNVRWYINELQRVRYVNQWLADVYCNKLREFFTAEWRPNSRDQREAEIFAQNSLAELASDVKKSAERYLRTGAERPESVDFDRIHDSVTKRLLAAIPADDGETRVRSAQPELPEPVTDGDLEDLAHAANQEALSFGVSLDPFLKLAKTVKARCMAAPVEQDQPKREAMSEAEILQLMAEVQARHAEDEDEKAGVIEFVRLVEARQTANAASQTVAQTMDKSN